MPNATFYNKLPVRVRVDWSNRGGATQSKEIDPLGSATFSHGRGSNIDYGILVLRNGNFEHIDQDWVSLWKDRHGEIVSASHPAVKWNSPLFNAEEEKEYVSNLAEKEQEYTRIAKAAGVLK